MINQWGPALLMYFAVLPGIIINDSRLSAFRKEMNNRFDDLMGGTNSGFTGMNSRFDDL